MKHHVQGVLANLSAMMPCFSLGGYKLPKVTGKKSRAAHHPSRASPSASSSSGGEPATPPLPGSTPQGRLWSPTSALSTLGWLPQLSWVSSLPQFPTTTQKSPSTPASSSRRRPPGFQTAPSPPSTPTMTTTTRDPSTLSLPEKVMSVAASPLLRCPGSILPHYRPWVSQGRVLAAGSIYFWSLCFAVCKDTPGTCLASCGGTCLEWAAPFANLGKCSRGPSCCMIPGPEVPSVSLGRGVAPAAPTLVPFSHRHPAAGGG